MNIKIETAEDLWLISGLIGFGELLHNSLEPNETVDDRLDTLAEHCEMFTQTLKHYDKEWHALHKKFVEGATVLRAQLHLDKAANRRNN